MGDYAAIYSKIWAPESKIKKKLFDTNKGLQPMTLQFLDLPNVHKSTEEGQELIYALYEMHKENEDLEVFGLKSVQILIDWHIEHWQNINRYVIGWPIFL